MFAKVVTVVLGMLCADDGRVVPRSPSGLAQVVVITVEVCAAIRFTVSDKKTRRMHMPEQHAVTLMLIIKAAGQGYSQTNKGIFLGDTVKE